MGGPTRWLREANSGKTRGARLPMVLVHLGLAIGVAALAYGEFKDRYLALRKAGVLMRAWPMTGPPCEAISETAFLRRGLVVNKGIEVNDVVIERRFGQARCVVIASGIWGDEDYPICRFAGPEVLKVTTPRAVAYFVTPIGRPAMVSTRQARPRCVLTGAAATLRTEGDLGR